MNTMTINRFQDAFRHRLPIQSLGIFDAADLLWVVTRIIKFKFDEYPEIKKAELR